MPLALSLTRMHWIDRYLGSIAVSLLQPFNVGHFLGRSPDLRGLAPSRILAIKFWGMGSIALAGSSLVALRKRYPRAEIVFLTLEANRAFVEQLALVDRVLSVDVGGSAPVVFARLARLIASLHRYRFDLVLDLEFFTRFSAIVSFLTLAPVRIGFHAWEIWRGNLHNVRVPFNRYWHVGHNFLNMARAAGVEHEAPAEFRIPISPAGRACAERALASSGVSDGERLVLMNPNAGELALERRWPGSCFAELARELERELEVRPVFIGASSERSYVEEVVRQAGGDSVNLAGEVDVPGLLALFDRSAALITNDSGPLQLALVQGLPTLSFFGPETPVLYGPLVPPHKVLYQGLACSPCINVHTHKRVRCIYGHPVCLETIEVKRALEAARGLLAPASRSLSSHLNREALARKSG